jgi:hypothetical protein
MLSGALYNGYGCLPLYTYLPEWSEQLESQGFALTMVLQTEGSAVRSVPLTAREEADSIEWFLRTHISAPRGDTAAGRTYLQSPWTIGVVPRAVVRQATPPADGRRWLADTTEFGRAIGAYNLQNTFTNGLVLLYDRSGTLLYAGRQMENALLHALIVRTLAEPKTATVMSPTARGS